ncbi:MAG: hypothetical protein JWQ94_2128 [Tardiphaga sp.]|jgi:hypothetical protein|nr:hypothetical protein [Tardiphaga sp.]
MQAAVDRVIRSLSFKQPMPTQPVAAMQDDATRFATQLLQNYRDQLAQRSRTDLPRQD